MLFQKYCLDDNYGNQYMAWNLLSAIFYTGFFVNASVGMYFGLSAIAGIVGGVIGVNLG